MPSPQEPQQQAPMELSSMSATGVVTQQPDDKEHVAKLPPTAGWDAMLRKIRTDQMPQMPQPPPGPWIPPKPPSSPPKTPPSTEGIDIPHIRRPWSPTRRPVKSILKKSSRWSTLTTPQSDPSGEWHDPMAIFPFSIPPEQSSGSIPTLSAGVSSGTTTSSSMELFSHNPGSSSKSAYREQEEVQGKGKGKAKDQTVRITTVEGVSNDKEIIRMSALKPKSQRVHVTSNRLKVKKVRFAGVESTFYNKEVIPMEAPKRQGQRDRFAIAGSVSGDGGTWWTDASGGKWWMEAPKPQSQGVHDKGKGQRVRLVSAENAPDDKEITHTKATKSKAQIAPSVSAENTTPTNKWIIITDAPKAEEKKKSSRQRRKRSRRF
ncbi:hypothetical protein F4803DRAFT_550310 [Xylaria telfairii]|nr:hypothetical protein F4803DRAFT_550310 [Xylaria telfairii]